MVRPSRFGREKLAICLLTLSGRTGTLTEEATCACLSRTQPNANQAGVALGGPTTAAGQEYAQADEQSDARAHQGQPDEFVTTTASLRFGRPQPAMSPDFIFALVSHCSRHREVPASKRRFTHVAPACLGPRSQTTALTGTMRSVEVQLPTASRAAHLWHSQSHRTSTVQGEGGQPAPRSAIDRMMARIIIVSSDRTGGGMPRKRAPEECTRRSLRGPLGKKSGEVGVVRGATAPNSQR